MPRSPIKLSFVNWASYVGIHSESPLFHSMACYQLASFLRHDPEIAQAFDISIETFEASAFWHDGFGPEDEVRSLAPVLTEAPAIVACSLYVWNAEQMHSFVQSLRQVMPGLTVIAGGPEVYERADFVELFPGYDILIEGDGEAPLREVLLRIRDGKGDLTGIRNVSFRRDEGWVHNASAASTTPGDEIPDFLLEAPGLLYGRGFYLGVRGCPNGCDYCLWARQPMSGKRRARVLRDLEALLAAPGLQSFGLFDYDIVEIYRHDPELFQALERLVAADGRRNRISAFVSPHNIVDPAMGMLFEKLGIETCAIGLQSGNVDALAGVNRAWASVQLELFERVPPELRHRFRVELIFPLPGETSESFTETARKLLGFGFARLRVFNLLVLRGSKLYRKREELGLKSLARPPYLCFETPQVPLPQFVRTSLLARALTLYGNLADSRSNARKLSDYSRAHPEVVDRMLAGLDAGRRVEEVVAALGADIFGASASTYEHNDDPAMRLIGRLVPKAPEAAPASGQPDVPHHDDFQAFFASRGIPLLGARRDAGAVVFELQSGPHAWSITIGPRRSGAKAFQSTRYYDVSYSGDSAPVAIVTDFVQLVKTLEARQRGIGPG